MQSQVSAQIIDNAQLERRCGVKRTRVPRPTLGCTTGNGTEREIEVNKLSYHRNSPNPNLTPFRACTSSISSLIENAPDVVPIVKSASSTSSRKVPDNPPPPTATGGAVSNNYNTIQTADLIHLVEKNCQVALMQMMAQLQLPSTMQIAVDCMRQVCVHLARQVPAPVQTPALVQTPLALPNGRYVGARTTLSLSLSHATLMTMAFRICSPGVQHVPSQ